MPANRKQPAPSEFVIHSWWWLAMAAGLSLVLQVVIFAPFDLWPLAYVCFVPWLTIVGATESPRRVYIVSYILGALFFSLSMRWLFLVTIGGSIILFLAMAFYFPLVACSIRHIVRRRRLPLAFTFPLIWVGCEAARSMIVPRLPWNLLGHSQHSLLTMIQISDLVGAYGVSFVVAAVNGMIVDVLLHRLGWPSMGDGHSQSVRHNLKTGIPSSRPSVAFCLVLMLLTVVYGQYQLRRNTSEDGPRIAIVQGNYPNYVDSVVVSKQPKPKERAQRYFELLREASLEGADLYLLPETPWLMYLNREFLSKPLDRWYLPKHAYTPQVCYESLRDFAIQNDAYLVTGSASLEPTPLDIKAGNRRYNSAFIFTPEGHEPERYDKRHLVLIGEYVPFRYGPLRFVYLWVNSIVPFGADGDDYSLTAGTEWRTFEMKVQSQDGQSQGAQSQGAQSQGGRTYGFATPICYENVMPYISRRFVTGPDGRKRCDFLLNLSNDGWFPHSSELPQHLAASVFRAVENRIGVARAVNTGISCFVDPDGFVHHVVEKNGVAVGPNVDGYRIANVRVDSRHSLYSRYGDVFAIFCAIVWGLFYLDYVIARVMAVRTRKEERKQ